MSTSTLSLVQITDLHLLAAPTGRLHGWRVADAFRAVLEDARARFPRPDGILLTGDLVHDESPAGYRWLGRQLAGWGPVWAIPGNHDDPAALASALDTEPAPRTVAVGDWRLHLLDSHVPGTDSGRLGGRQRRLLAAAIGADAPALVVLHHPPVAVGSAWIDALGLADGPELRQLLRARPTVRGVVAGHVHQAVDRRVDHWRLLTAPATCRQFLPGSKAPAEDPGRPPGYRSLRLHADGRLTTRLHRVPTARAACG